MLRNDLVMVALSRADFEFIKLAVSDLTDNENLTVALRARRIIDSIREQASVQNQASSGLAVGSREPTPSGAAARPEAVS